MPQNPNLSKTPAKVSRKTTHQTGGYSNLLAKKDGVRHEELHEAVRRVRRLQRGVGLLGPASSPR